ncbi:hypothetical protein EPN81_01365 [Patescibacteria group bacterium]|nr:MAG: hypothetical protein EPN81_01365 [Patescibacteria group bacterium]
MLAILSLLLAFATGCGEPSNCTDCGDDDATVDSNDFSATLRSVAPYGWVGDHYIYPVNETLPDADCVDAVECDVDVEELDQRVRLSAWNFSCVPQEVNLNDGETVDIDWTWEGACSVVPDGVYSGYDVRTDILDVINGFDQMTISIESWYAVITGNEFLYDGGGYYLEGTVSDDLTTIEFSAISGTGSEFGGTITLEE